MMMTMLSQVQLYGFIFEEEGREKENTEKKKEIERERKILIVSCF